MQKTSIKRAALLLCAVLMAFQFAACGKKDKTYTSDQGISITMEDGMEEKTQSGASVYYEGKKALAVIIKENFADFQTYGIDTDAYTIEKYESLIKQANGLTDDFEVDENGNPYLTYEQTVSGAQGFYFVTVKKGTDAFWVITFACAEDDSEDYLPKFKQWSDSIEVQ